MENIEIKDVAVKINQKFEATETEISNLKSEVSKISEVENSVKNLTEKVSKFETKSEKKVNSIQNAIQEKKDILEKMFKSRTSSFVELGNFETKTAGTMTTANITGEYPPAM
jgi:DNA anti-recombination protein RmuC